MRATGFTFDSSLSFSAPREPRQADGQRPPPKRRLDDDIEAIFSRACATSNIDAAGDLLAVLEKWHIRRTKKYGRERRINSLDLQAARRKLERLAAARPTPSRPAPAE